MSLTCLSCGKPLGSSPGLCYSCRQEGIELEDVVDVEGAVLDRIERYLLVSAVRCDGCGELHERITVDGETHTAETLGIESVEEWEREIEEAEAWLTEHAGKVREALALVESEWPASTQPVRDVVE